MTYQFNPDHGPLMRAAITRISWAMRRTRDAAEFDRLARAHDTLYDCLGGRCCEAADWDEPCRCSA
jgi:hypothetical protein